MESSLEIMSKLENMSNLKLKKYSSAKEQTKQTPFSHLESNSPDNLTSQSSDHIKNMQKQIDSIENQQKKLKDKFEKIVQQLSQQIEHRDKRNQQLESQVKQLRKQVETSREDFKIIVAYLCSKKQRQMKAISSRPWKLDKTTTLNSTKDSGKVDKSTSRIKVVTRLTNSSGITNFKIKGSSQFRNTKLRRNKSDLFEY